MKYWSIEMDAANMLLVAHNIMCISHYAHEDL